MPDTRERCCRPLVAQAGLETVGHREAALGVAAPLPNRAALCRRLGKSTSPRWHDESDLARGADRELRRPRRSRRRGSLGAGERRRRVVRRAEGRLHAAVAIHLVPPLALRQRVWELEHADHVGLTHVSRTGRAKTCRQMPCHWTGAAGREAHGPHGAAVESNTPSPRPDCRDRVWDRDRAYREVVAAVVTYEMSPAARKAATARCDNSQAPDFREPVGRQDDAGSVHGYRQNLLHDHV
jgi:hypothetical protein